MQPHSPAVLEIRDKAGDVLRHIGSPSDTFVGYAVPYGREDLVDLQLRAIYQTLRGKSFDIGYIGPGMPVFNGSSPKPVGQFVRMPEEIIKHHRGTCHDLVLLLAACAEHIRIRPLIILIDGHTLLGYWKSEKSCREYWQKRETLRSDRFGSTWVIDSIADVERLVRGQAVSKRPGSPSRRSPTRTPATGISTHRTAGGVGHADWRNSTRP